MRFPVSFILLATASASAAPVGFKVLATEGGAWPEILSSVGFRAAPAKQAGIFVLRPGSAGSAEWPARVENGAFLILEGESPVADLFGFRKTAQNTRVASITDVHLPELSIVWQAAQEMPLLRDPARGPGFREGALDRRAADRRIAARPRGRAVGRGVARRARL